MVVAEPSSSDAPPPPLHRRARRLVFDRRYGWIFDQWTDPAEQALSGCRGMFSVVPMAQSLVNAVACSISHVASSVTGKFGRHKRLSSLPCMYRSLSHKKQQDWFRELGHSGAIANLKLIHNVVFLRAPHPPRDASEHTLEPTGMSAPATGV